MTMARKMRLVPLMAVALLCIFATVYGCRKKAVVYSDRSEDPKYVKQLKDLSSEQRQVANDRAKVQEQMDAFRRRAAANLGGAPSADQIDYELNSYPAKYPGWKELVNKDSACAEEMKRKLAEARAKVRARIVQEAADKQALKDGRAKPATR